MGNKSLKALITMTEIHLSDFFLSIFRFRCVNHLIKIQLFFINIPLELAQWETVAFFTKKIGQTLFRCALALN